MTESESVALPLGDTPIGSWSRVRTCDIVINSHALYRLSYSGIYRNIFTDEANYVERKTGLEPATPTLARLCSTTELLPHLCQQRYYYIITSLFVKLCRKTFTVNSLSINVMFNRLSYISQWCQYFLLYFCVFPLFSSFPWKNRELNISKHSFHGFLFYAFVICPDFIM